MTVTIPYDLAISFETALLVALLAGAFLWSISALWKFRIKSFIVAMAVIAIVVMFVVEVPNQ